MKTLPLWGTVTPLSFHATTRNLAFKLFSKLLTVFGIVMMFAISGWGDTSSNDDCTNAEVNATFSNLSSASNGIMSGKLTSGSDEQDYYKITITNAGTLEINASSSETFDFSIGKSCSGTTCGTDVYATGNPTPSSHQSGIFTVAAGDVVYLKVSRNNKTLTYNISINYQPPVRVGFQQINYQISENTALPYDQYTIMPMYIILDRAVSFPVQVTYLSSDGTAKAGLGKDYKSAGGIVTIPAGQTTAEINVSINHDEVIELSEYFTVALSNPVGTGSVELNSTHKTATVTILEQLTAPICYQDNFNQASLDGTWRTLKSSGTFTPGIVNDRLRMTPAQGNMSTAVTKDYEFASAENIIEIEFTQYAYSGSGADGFALVLYDTLVGASPIPGAFGGSLGYAQKCQNGQYYGPYNATCSSDCTTAGGCSGFQSGWLGLGIDEYGNYQNPTEGRIGGVGFQPNRVSIRGDGSGVSGYEYLSGTGTLTPSLWNSGSTPNPGHKYRMTVDARDTAHLYITLKRDSGSGYVTVINQFDAKEAQYNQSTTPNFVRLALTASTGGSNAIHEIDDITVWGRCVPYNPNPPSPPTTGSVDIVDANYTDGNYTDGNGPDIQTKIAQKGEYKFDAVYLGHDGSGVENYVPAGTSNNLPLTVKFTLADGECNELGYTVTDTSNNSFGWIEIPAPTNQGQAYNHATSVYPITFPNTARQDTRLMIRALDWNDRFSNYSVNNNCFVSSTHGALCGVPSCLSSAEQAREAFSLNDTNATIRDQNRRVLTECYGLSSDGSGNIATTSACNVNNYQGSCGGVSPTGNIEPDKYETQLGCLACILDKSSTPSCSVDHFAMRPKIFDITSTSNHWPDLLTSGEDYNTTLKAFTFTGNLTNDYNVSNANAVLELNTSARYYPNNTLDTTGALVGVFSMGTDDFNMSNGISVKSGAASNEVMPINFSDVGKMTLQVLDRIWSAIDNDDTSLNCNGTYICGDTNTTLIPYDFNISSLSINNNNGNPGTFTYLGRIGDTEAILKSMSGRFDLNVSAQNKNGLITQNFRQAAWENNVTVVPTVYDNLHGDANETVITNLAVGFGTGTDANGTKHLLWNETNSSLMLRFNFNKSPRVPVNPFRVDGNETNMTISALYAGSAPIGSRTISGSRIQNADQNVTFVYGRIIPRDVRVFGNVAFVANAWYEAYNTPTLNGASLAASKIDAMWYVNNIHTDVNDGDGNVTVIIPTTPLTLPTHSSSTAGMETYQFSAIPLADIPYSGKAHINTDPWLWYGINALNYADPVNSTNLDCLTHPCFNITVVPSIGATGSAKSTNESTKGSKKSDSGGGTWKSTSDYAPAIR